MSIDLAPRVPPLPGIELLSALKYQITICFLEGNNLSLLWELRDSWLRYDDGAWWIGPDDPATEDEVRELLAKTGELPRRYA